MSSADAISTATEKLNDLMAPIGGGAGADVSYDETFELLKAEVEKMTSMGGGKVDWSATASNAAEILTDKGKDFRVAVYYVAARAHLDGVVGLFEGFLVLQALITGFWEPMGPPLKRPKARGNLCPWLAELCAPLVAGYQPTVRDRDVVGALDQVSRAVDSDLAEKLGDAYGGMSQLRSSIANLVRALPPEPPPPPPPAPPAPTPPPGASAQAVEERAPSVSAAPTVAVGDAGASLGPSVEAIVDSDSASQALSQCTALLAQVAAVLRDTDPTDSQPFRLLRGGVWLELKASPPVQDGSNTYVPAPASSWRSEFDALASSGDWLGLVRSGEGALVEAPLWLDTHRFVAAALERLGSTFEDARMAVLREVALLLARVPSLEDLRFNDGTPFADDETKAWLAAEVRPVFGTQGGGGARKTDPLQAAIEASRALVAQGNLVEALQGLADATKNQRSPLSRFRGRLASAQLCLQAEQFMIAKAQLDGLERTVERHNLVEWDTELAVEFSSALYLAHRGANLLSGGDVSLEARAKEIAAFEQLCRLDPTAALKLTLGV